MPRGGCRWLSLGLGQLSGGSWVTVTPALKCSACSVPNPRSAAGRHRRLIHFMDEGTDGERASSYGEVTESGSSWGSGPVPEPAPRGHPAARRKGRLGRLRAVRVVAG